MTPSPIDSFAMARKRGRGGGTLAHRLLQSYRETPDRPALHLLFPKEPELTLDYRALVHGSAAYARALEQAGVARGEVVILILQHGADLVYAFWGAILRGAIPGIMPFLTEKLAPEKYRAELAALFGITQPAAVITYPDFAPEAEAAARDSSVRVILRAPDVRPLTDLDVDSLPGLDSAPDAIALLQHSSGTTGLQKGVALAHRAVLTQLAVYARAVNLTPDDVIVSWLPLYHDMGLIAGFILPIICRVPLVLLSPFDWVRAPAKLLHAVTRYRGTLAWLPNFAYNFCAQKIRDRDLQGVDLSSWRAIINCSEPMRWESHQAFTERFRPYGLNPAALATCYAMAENVFAVTQGGIHSPVVVDEVDRRTLLVDRVARRANGNPETLKMLSAGKPLPNVRVRILDDARHDVPERVIGEIALQSDCLLTGYYHRDDATEKAFHAGWYLTGDFGYTAEGEVYVTGRKKDLIIVGGKNVYPQDVELLASEVPGVHPGRVVAFGVFNDEAGTEEVVLVAEVETEDEEERNRLADALRQKVTRGSDVTLRMVHLVGPRWVLKTSSGKTARAANREKYLAELKEQAMVKAA